MKEPSKIPLGRHARPEEIAALFAFLASEDAGFATGQVYVMDGAETTGGLKKKGTGKKRNSKAHWRLSPYFQ